MSGFGAKRKRPFDLSCLGFCPISFSRFGTAGRLIIPAASRSAATDAFVRSSARPQTSCWRP